MAKRKPLNANAGAPAKDQGQVVPLATATKSDAKPKRKKPTVYLDPEVLEKLEDIAHSETKRLTRENGGERTKVFTHDLLLLGVDLVLQRYGYSALASTNDQLLD